MKKDGANATRWVDLLGGTVVAGCILGACWMAFVHGDGTREEVAQVSEHLRAASRDVASLRTVLDRRSALVVQRTRELADRGQLPTRAPVEAYFRELSRLAQECQLNVVSQEPRTPRQYPGLLEQRFSYDVSGPTDGIMRFLAAIERTEFWADVSYLKIQHGPGAENVAAERRSASLTLSLFSTLPVEAPAERAEGT